MYPVPPDRTTFMLGIEIDGNNLKVLAKVMGCVTRETDE
jgi:hypothetical protein